MTDTIFVPLNKLIRDPKNVRKTYNQAGIAALAASIKTDGLIQDPVVRKADKKDCFFVIAGGRRIAALKQLVENGELDAAAPVQCKLRSDENAEAVSLAENIMREAMTPAEELVAYGTLIESGLTIGQIAQRFATTETVVRKRLALARVSPALMALYDENKLDLSQLEAFTLTDDHEEQERVWNSLSPYSRSSREIRQALTGHGVPATDKRVRFIGGLDAFEAAGGAVKRDLFNEDSGFVLDSALLDQMVIEGLEKQALEIRAEGWSWVDVRPDFSYDDYGNYGRRYPQPVELSVEDQAELDQLSSDYDDLVELLNVGEGGEEDRQRLGQLEERIDELTAKRNAYEAQVLEVAGAVVILNNQGGIRVERGLVHPDMEKALRLPANDQTIKTPQTTAKPTKPVHSQALLEDLTAQKTAAMRAELVNNPAIALVAVVHALLLPVLYTYSRTQSALQISLHIEDLASYMSDAEGCKGLIELTALRELFGQQLPGDGADLFGWLSGRTQDQLLDLLAYAAAHAVNVVEKKHTDRSNGIAQGNELGRALNINIADWFTTTGDNYLSRINRQGIEQAVTEAKGEQKALAVKVASKKTEAVTIADRLLEGTNWIPAPLRIAPALVPVDHKVTTFENSNYTLPEAAE